MKKLTVQEWNKLSEAEQREALLQFREPNPFPVKNKIDINKLDYDRFK